jgi:hypothetical protein
VLHWKTDTGSITNGDIDRIFAGLFGTSGQYPSPAVTVFDLICEQAKSAASAPEGVNFENKIVLSIAIRLLAEKYMEAEIGDPSFFESIRSNQTHFLHKEYLRRNLGSADQRRILDWVVLMTPANLHVNSFMYEPIIDMADEHLRKLYQEVMGLSEDGSRE